MIFAIVWGVLSGMGAYLVGRDDQRARARHERKVPVPCGHENCSIEHLVSVAELRERAKRATDTVQTDEHYA